LYQQTANSIKKQIKKLSSLVFNNTRDESLYSRGATLIEAIKKILSLPLFQLTPVCVHHLIKKKILVKSEASEVFFV
jgi:phage terminase large subunit-like protein